MSVTATVKTGPQNYQTGVEGPARGGKTGEVIVQELHGQLYETTKQGNLYIASTAAAGVAPGTVLSTTPPFTLWNPINSPVDLVILAAYLGYISGTLGAGTVFWAVNNAGNHAVPATGTPLVPISGRLGQVQGQGRAYQGSTITLPTVLRPFCSLGAHLASTAVQPWQILEDVKGKIIVPPGCTLSLQAVAAGGSTPLVAFGVEWEEVDI